MSIILQTGHDVGDDFEIIHIYDPGIYAEGYILVFPFVRSYVCMFVCSSIMLTKITTKFCVKVSQMGISQRPLIRKLSYCRRVCLHSWIKPGGNLGEIVALGAKILP